MPTSLLARPGLVLLAFCLFAYGAVLGLFTQGGQMQQGWRYVGVTPLHEMFYDLRPLLEGFVCAEKGEDIMRTNSCDPLGRAVNYPPVWLSLKDIGANPTWLHPMSWAMVGIFALSALWLFRRTSLPQSLVATLCVLSPSVMMGVERGNVDLILFALVMFGALCIRHEDGRGLFGATLLFIAVLLKLYPVFAIAALMLLPSPIVRRRLFILLALSAAYFLFEHEALALIQKNTPVGTELSYGIMTPWLVYTKTQMELRSQSGAAFWLTRAMLFMILAGMLLLTHKRIIARLESTPELALLLAGAGVFCGTFLISNNWDYRLVFLLLCLPWAFQWPGLCGLIAAVLWTSAFSAELSYADELMSLALWLVLAVLLLQFAAQDLLRLRIVGKRRNA